MMCVRVAKYTHSTHSLICLKLNLAHSFGRNLFLWCAIQICSIFRQRNMESMQFSYCMRARPYIHSFIHPFGLNRLLLRGFASNSHVSVCKLHCSYTNSQTPTVELHVTVHMNERKKNNDAHTTAATAATATTITCTIEILMNESSRIYE